MHESAWHRAFADTERFRKRSRLWYWLVEVVGGSAVFGIAGGLLGSKLTPAGASGLQQIAYPIVGAGIGGLAGFVVVFVLIYAWNLFRAPYRQRDEARSASVRPGVDEDKYWGDADVLVKYLKAMTRIGNYTSAMRFGSSVSRPLWLQGEYRARIETGRIVEDAAAKLSNKRAQAAALIDDIGWTYVPLKQYGKARENIEYGRKIASDIGDHYLLAKAWRHLGGIALVEKGAVDEAIEYCNKAQGVAQQIKDPDAKTEMIAGIEYGLSKIHWMKGDMANAERYCLAARDKYGELGDLDRLAATYSQLGKVYEKMEKLKEAKDEYRHGLIFAEKANVRAETIRNHLGIARALLKEQNSSEAASHLKVARELHGSTPTTFEVGNMDIDLELLEGNHQ